MHNIPRNAKGIGRRRLAVLLIITFIGLVEQEIGRQLLVLVTGKVGLNDHVSFEAKTAKLDVRVSI